MATKSVAAAKMKQRIAEHHAAKSKPVPLSKSVDTALNQLKQSPKVAAALRKQESASTSIRVTHELLQSTEPAYALPSVQPAHDFLDQASTTIAQRAAQRDNTGGNGERSMAATVAAFNAIEGTTLTTRQGWSFMQLLKITRAASSARNGKHDADSYIDGAAYAGLAGEEASREECKRRTTHQIVIGGEQP